MKKIVALALLLSFLFLSGCQTQEPEVTATPEPVTAEPITAESTTQPDEGVSELDAEGEGDLAGGQVVPGIETLETCFVEPPESFDLDVDIDCGYVIVPEFYSQPSDKMLQIGFMRFKARQETAAAPLFILGGGPGQDMMTEQSFLNFNPQMIGSILDTRDIVLLNQRGVKHTEPVLDCPAFHALEWTAAEQGTTYLSLLGETLQSCVDELEAQGVNFDAFNSVEIAADVNAARQALGYDRIVYYGASYGAQLGQHVMRDFPEMLESVVLDGANSLSRRSWIEDRALDAQWGLDNLTALCEADEACRETYDIQALVEEKFALLDSAPLPYTYTDPSDPTISFDVEVTKGDLANFIFKQFGSATIVVGIPYILTNFAPDVETLTEALVTEKGQAAVDSRDATEGGVATLMHYAVACSDDPVDSTEDLVIDETVGEFARQYGEGIAEEYAIACDVLDVQRLPDNTDENVTVDIPTLILAGSLDVSTPAYRSQIVADALPNDTFVVIPGRTHIQIDGANTCAGQIMTQFVVDPAAPPDTACAEEYVPFPFMLPDAGQNDQSPGEEAGADEEREGMDTTLTDAKPVFASGKFWQWRTYLDPVNGETTIDDEQAYTLTLTDDGLAILAGLCLAVVGSYERGDDTLSLTYDLPENLDETCEPGPNEARFFELMQGAARYYSEADQLFIELAADGGTLVFDVLEDRSEDVEEVVTAVDLCGDAALNLNEIEATLDAQQVAALDELLPTYITEGSAIRPPAPGAALLVITPQGRYFKSIGVADVTSCEPLPAEALFEIGSNTKMMTAAIIYQLQEEGVLSTSDLISQWVPEIAALVPNSDQITIDMLLTHTNGIYDYLNGTGNNGPLAAGATDREVLTAAYTPEELVELAVTSGEPYFAPGEAGQWMYSNTGYILLGQIIEAATGKSYGENLEERIFQPLGLTRTFLVEGQPEPGLLPTGYFRSPFDYTTTEWNMSQGWSAGAVISDAEEVGIFLKALFSGELFQNPETLDLMLAPASPDYGLFSDQFYYGHGMFYKNGLLGHGGQALGYQSDVGYLPAEDMTIVLWTNSAENTAGQAATAVGEALGIVTTAVMP